MRRTIATFHRLSAADRSDIESLAAIPRPAGGRVDPFERALKDRSIEVRDWREEGVMAIWPLIYLMDRHVFDAGAYWRAPLAKAILARLQADPRRKARTVALFAASEAADLAQRLTAAHPSDPEILAHHDAKLQDALGAADGAERLSDDPSVPALVATCSRAYRWLTECLQSITPDTIGLLIIRDNPPHFSARVFRQMMVERIQRRQA